MGLTISTLIQRGLRFVQQETSTESVETREQSFQRDFVENQEDNLVSGIRGDNDIVIEEYSEEGTLNRVSLSEESVACYPDCCEYHRNADLERREDQLRQQVDVGPYMQGPEDNIEEYNPNRFLLSFREQGLVNSPLQFLIERQVLQSTPNLVCRHVIQGRYH